jgi:hypothetical protein
VASSLDSLYVNTAALALPSDAPSAAVAAPAAATAPQAILYELPDGSKVDVSVLERSLAANVPILSRAVIHHIPGQNFFVSLLALRTQVDSAIGSNSSAAILLHDDVVAAIAARGSSATSTMEAKSDK